MEPEQNTESEEVVFLIDESYGMHYCGVCIVSIQGFENYDRITQMLKRMEVDAAIRAYIPAGDYHFTDNSISGRQSLVPWISSMPISVYLAVSQEYVSNTKQAKDDLVYKKFFPEVLKPQIIKHLQRSKGEVSFQIIFENLSEKKNADTKYFSEIIQSFSLPTSVHVEVKSKKEEPLSFIPDYYLGFLNQRLLKQKWAAESFKLMADRVGLLMFFDGANRVRHERGQHVFDYLTDINL